MGITNVDVLAWFFALQRCPVIAVWLAIAVAVLSPTCVLPSSDSNHDSALTTHVRIY